MPSLALIFYPQLKAWKRLRFSLLFHDCTLLLVVKNTCNTATLANQIETNSNFDKAYRVFFLLIAVTYIHVFLKFDYLMIAYFRSEWEKGYRLKVQCFLGLFGGQALVMIDRWY